MKIEKYKPSIAKHNGSAADSLRLLKPGEAVRIKTAQDWRRIAGVVSSIGRELGVKFTTANDGDCDVLIFIPPAP